MTEDVKNLVNAVSELFEGFTKESEAYLGGNKSAGRRARKISLEIGKGNF